MPRRRHWSEEEIAQVVAAYEAGETIAAIASRLHLARKSVTQILEKARVPIRTRPRKFPPYVEAEIAGRYASGEPSTHLSKEYGTGYSTILDIAKRQGISKRPAGRKPQLSPEEELRIARRYESGESSRAIAKEYSLNPNTIIQIAGRHGIYRQEAKSLPTSGDRSPRSKRKQTGPGEETWWQRLRRLRVARGYSQGGLARRAGIHPVTISLHESGGVERPHHRMLQAYAQALDVSLDELRYGPGRRPEPQESLEELIEEYLGLQDERSVEILLAVSRVLRKWEQREGRGR